MAGLIRTRFPGHGPAVPDPRVDPDHRHLVPLDQFPEGRDRAGDHRHAAAGAPVRAGGDEGADRPRRPAQRGRPVPASAGPTAGSAANPRRDRPAAAGGRPIGAPPPAAAARAEWPIARSERLGKGLWPCRSKLLAAVAGCAVLGACSTAPLPQPARRPGFGEAFAMTWRSRPSIPIRSIRRRARSPATVARRPPRRPSAIAPTGQGHQPVKLDQS